MRFDQTGPRSKYNGVIRSKTSFGYLCFSKNGKSYKAHRAAFVLMGIDPTGYDVDHINGDRSDNRWENLRLVTRRANSINKAKHRQGALAGATKSHGKWQSRIRVNGKTKFLGTFATEKEAHSVYVKELENMT